MHYIQAIVALGLFGWLGYAVAFDALPDGDGGSSRTRGLVNMAESFAQTLGPGLSGAILLSIGIVIAWFALRRSG